jgi:hypothetical protein
MVDCLALKWIQRASPASRREIAMARLEIGQQVGIPCDVGHGAFAEEYLVTLITVEGPVSGFVSQENLIETEAGKGLLKGVVVELEEETVTVKVRGSFFTTTGLAYLPKDWASSNLKPL